MKNTSTLFDGLTDKLCSMVRGKMQTMSKMSSGFICKTTDGYLLFHYNICLSFFNDLFNE